MSDLNDIDSWIRPRADDRVADRINETILVAIERLGRYPLIGKPGRRAGTRELIISRYPYPIIYEADSDHVTVARVMHTRQLWPPAEDG